MAEYIEREALLEALNSDILNDETCPMFVAAAVDQLVSMAPAADVEPVRHGHVVEAEHEYDYGVYHSYRCSACGGSFGNENPGYLYCPYCKTKLDEKQNQEG